MRPLLLFIILFIIGLLMSCSEPTTQLENGWPAPTFNLPDLSGKPVHFPSDLKGKITAIRFWADWCPFCEHEMKQLEPVYRKYRDQGLVILAINVRQDRKTAERFIHQLGISYDVLLDEEGEVARNYGVTGLPTTFFVAGDGTLKSRVLGESTPELFQQIIIGMLQSR